MADNVTITSGIATATVAADEISSAYVQRVKIHWGVDGSGVDASATDPFPVALVTGAITTGATSLTKAVDAATGGTDTGVALLAKRVDSLATITPANGDYTWVQVDSSGRVYVYAYGQVSVIPQTSGGWTLYRMASSAGSTNATSVKASAGQLGGGAIINTNASARYVKLYDKASAPTVGSDTPAVVLKIEGSSQLVVNEILCGLPFANGIAFGTTTGVTDADSTAVNAGDLMIHLWYK